LTPARIADIGPSDGPVEPGERRVIEALRDGLDDRFTIAPNVQVVHRGGQVDDVDVLVVGPYGVVVIEVKNLAGQVIVSEREMYVDGHQRGNPYVQTYAKARRIKSRLTGNRLTKDTWVSPFVVLAQEPRLLQVPDDQSDGFVLIDEAVDALMDPGRWRGNGLDESQCRAALTELRLSSRPRPANLSLGPYKLGQLLSETSIERRYQATHTALGTEHEIVHIGYDPSHLGPDRGRAAISSAYREAIALRDVGPHRNLRAASDLFTEPDGSAVLVLPPRAGGTLRELLEDGPIDIEQAETILGDVVAALDHIHGGGVAHRRVCPTTIEIDVDGRAVLGGFGFAQVPGQVGGTQYLSLGLPPEETVFVAPEVFLQGTADTAADLFSLGILAEELDVSSLGGMSLDGLAVSDPADRTPSIDELAEALESDDSAEDGGSIDGHHVLKTLSESGYQKTELGYNVLSGEQVVLRSYYGSEAVDLARRIFQAMSASRDPGLEDARTMLQGSDGSVVIVSSFVDGVSLAEAIDTGSLGDAPVEIILHLADSVARLHENGWVHGDITPSNVILGDRGPVLIDFGIACEAADQPHGGTPAYRPLPGWERAESATGLDLFSLGIIAHQVLHGSRPEITDDGLEIEVDEPWSGAVAGALGLDGSPDLSSVDEFVEALAASFEQESESTVESDSDAVSEDGGLYRRVDELIIAGRLDEAEQLCPAEWTNLRERIVRARQQHPILDEEPDAFATIGDVTLTAERVSRELVPMTISGERDVRARVSQLSAQAHGVLARLEVVEADNGETWITCTDVSGSTEMYNAIVNRLRIGARDVDGGRKTIDLALATFGGERWVARSATGEEIEQATGVPIEAPLDGLGEVQIGTRAETIGDRSPRRGYLSAVFDEDSVVEILARAFTHLRILPLLMAERTVDEDLVSSSESDTVSGYPPDIVPSSSVGFESPKRVVIGRLVEIVEVEGPMNIKRLMHSFRRQAGVGRVTRTRRAILSSAIDRAAHRGDLEMDGRSSDDETVVRCPNQPWMSVREAGNRSLEEIPLNELAAVIDHVATGSPRLTGDALFDHVLRDFYDRDRVHESAMERLRRARGRAVSGVSGRSGKYDRLRRYLADQTGRSVTMDFDEISNLVGGLPPSAYDHQAWWSNSRSHSHAAAWLDNGWRAVAVNLNTQSVRFVR